MISPKKYEELKRQVDDLLERGLIRESMSPCAIPTLLVLKKNGFWCMCVDSSVINKITVEYIFPILRLNDLHDQLHRDFLFSKIDLKSLYHHIRMSLGDEGNIAFKIGVGLFE